MAGDATMTVSARTPSLWRAIREGSVIVALVLTSVWYAKSAFDHAAAWPDFYYLSPAIGVATGHGFTDPVPAPGSALHLFLAGQTQSLSWADAQSQEWRPPDQSAHANRYLMTAVGMVWRWSGISWEALGYVASGLHILTVLGTYGLLRLMVPLPLAALGGTWMAVSTLSLKLIPHVRDYSKGAFIIATLPLIAMLVLRGSTRSRLAALAAATGLLAGIGFGFKFDVAVTVPLAVAAVVIFLGRRPWTDLLDKSAAVAMLLLGFLVAAGPVIFRLSSGGSNAAHVILLGWAASFDVPLGIEPSAYSILPFYSDDYVARMVQAAAGRQLPFTTPDYDQASLALWLDLARAFPGDLVTRILGAANHALNLAFLNPDPTFVSRPLPASPMLKAVFAWMNGWHGWGAWVGIALVMAASWSSVRRGLFAAFVILAIGGYPFLQFGERHYFHTQVLSVVAILGSLWGAINLTRMLWRTPAWPSRAIGVRLLTVAAVVAVITLGPLAALRAHQSHSLTREFVRFQRRGPVKMPVEVLAGDGGTWFARWPRPQSNFASLDSAYYLVEFRVEQPSEPILIGIRYESRTMEHDYSRVLTLHPSRGLNLVGFPAISAPEASVFVGIQLGTAAARLLSGVYLLPNGPAGVPVDIALPADWREHALYQRFAGASLVRSTVSCANGAGCDSMLGYLEAITTHAGAPGAEFVSIVHSPAARITPQGIVVDGVAENDSAYLVQLKDIEVQGASAFVVQGHLSQGGIAIGLLRERRWYKQVFINSPGDFKVAIAVDEPGTYQPLFTSAMPSGQRRIRARFEKVAMLPAGRMD